MLYMFRGPLEEITGRNWPNTSGGREEALKRPEAAPGTCAKTKGRGEGPGTTG